MADNYANLIIQAQNIFKNEVWFFVERKLSAKYGANWQEKVRSSLREHRTKNNEVAWDTQALLDVMISRWRDDFDDRLNLADKERSLLFSIKEVRNSLAHEHQFTFDAAYRGLDYIQSFLKAIKSPRINEIDGLRAEARRINREEETELTSKQAPIVQATPASIEMRNTKERPKSISSESGSDERPAFLADLVKRLNKARPGLTTRAAPTRNPYWSFSSGRSGFDYGWAFRPNGTLVAEVYLEQKNTKPKAPFYALKKQQAEIDTHFGKPLIWQLNEGKTASRIYTELIFSITDQAQKQELAKQWAVESLIKLIEVFQQRIMNLDF